MFTGIIKKVSEVQRVSRQKGSFFVLIKKPKGWEVEKGESISINGVCSTVRSVGEKNFEVEYMPETLKKTTARNFESGTKVNLEKSLRVGDLLGGHFVQGHVDTTGKIIEVNKVRKSRLPKPGTGGQAKVLKVSVPAKFMKFIVPKGSIAVDGVSLTVVETGKDWFTTSPFRKNDIKKLKTNNKFLKQAKGRFKLKKVWWFSVSLVSYTLENTNLDSLKAGEKVNIETDMLAKYLSKLIKQ